MRAAIPRLHVPMLQPEDLIPHLGKREHWNVKHSAYALCATWWQANSVPPAVRLVLQTQPELAELELIDGFFERQVELGDGGFTDFLQFATVLGLPAIDINRVVGPVTLNGVALFFGWAADRLPAAAASTSGEGP